MTKISYVDIGLRYMLSPYYAPVARVKSGDIVTLETQDATGGQIRREGDVERVPWGNPVVGPVYIENAENGDSVSVTIEEIKPLEGQGTTYVGEFTDSYATGTSIMKFAGEPLPKSVTSCRIHDGRVFLKNGISLPYEPMLGVVGVAPSLELESMSTSYDPGHYGGNLDIPEICPGNTVFLPVFHQGGLVYVGDAHAVQGDGEITGTAVEMSAEVRLRLAVHKGKKIECPRIETEKELICVATTNYGKCLKEAIVEAFLQLSIWIETDYGLNRHDAFILCGQAGKIRIGNLWTVAAKMQKSILAPLVKTKL
ncbi:MAG: acetamidase/formamidase family protein [Candidatus Bathyarchaeia archaeon]